LSLAQVPDDFPQILSLAGAKQPTEFVEIYRRSVSYGPRRFPRRQGPPRPKPSYQTAKEHRGITAGLRKHCKARKKAATFQSQGDPSRRSNSDLPRLDQAELLAEPA
jgi:hypothetical protein